MQKELRPLRTLFDTLVRDVSSIVGRSRASLSQAKRRSLIRALFALIEADVYKKKKIALTLHEEGLVHFTLSELVLLKEEQYDLDPRGSPRTSKKFLRLPDNLKFAFGSFCKATKIDHSIDATSKGWQAFRHSIELRNRITHPKNPSDLAISDLDLQKVLQTFIWFKKNAEEIAVKLSHMYPDNQDIP